ncbi:hypothetical protein F0562_002599 [Nyssa sinensis]|uniref:FAF domain-containing protein n=1 Tax=Nyssa sinensis TaxID=561372 RepID=A0A5J5C678_9ASTE|nr:hypothetical protein F0562_002599 [Nyssa sinensis]
MSFFGKSFRSILGLSNSDDQSTLRRRDILSTEDRLISLVSTARDIQPPSSVPESVTVKPSFIAGFSGGQVSSEISATGLDDQDSIDNNSRWIGCEESPQPAGSSSRKTISRARREKAMSKNFPPLLSTLNQNGRPRFNLSKVRKNGRLQIITVPNHQPEVVRTPRRDGGLRMQLLDREEEELSLSEDDLEEDDEDEREDGGPDRGVKATNGNGLRP